MTQTEVAKALGVSRQKIWNIENNALKKLQALFGVTKPRAGSRTAKPRKP